MPPSAATMDSAAMRGLLSLPWTDSCLISRATRKKNSIIKLLFIQSLNERANSKEPTSRAIRVS